MQRAFIVSKAIWTRLCDHSPIGKDSQYSIMLDTACPSEMFWNYDLGILNYNVLILLLSLLENPEKTLEVMERWIKVFKRGLEQQHSVWPANKHNVSWWIKATVVMVILMNPNSKRIVWRYPMMSEYHNNRKCSSQKSSVPFSFVYKISSHLLVLSSSQLFLCTSLFLLCYSISHNQQPSVQLDLSLSYCVSFLLMFSPFLCFAYKLPNMVSWCLSHRTTQTLETDTDDGATEHKKTKTRQMQGSHAVYCICVILQQLCEF